MTNKKIFDFEIIFQNEESDIFCAEGENEFEAIQNFLSYSKDTINNKILSINFL